MLDTLTLEHDGKITLPDTVRDHYHLTAETPLRIIETRNGILLIPLTQEPMSDALVAELAQWQASSADNFALFPYEDQAA